MGKVRNKRRLHNKAVKAAKDAAEADMELDSISRAPSVVDGGMFSNVNIDINQLADKLPDVDDARSVVSSKSLRGLNLKKKDKRKVKHEFLMKKIDVIQAAKMEAKNKKKREKTAIVGDMQPLQDTLPTLELLMRGTGKHKGTRPEPKPKGIHTTKRRKREMLSDISAFQQVLKHPAYQANPLATISEHLQNKHKLEQQSGS